MLVKTEKSAAQGRILNGFGQGVLPNNWVRYWWTMLYDEFPVVRLGALTRIIHGVVELGC